MRDASSELLRSPYPGRPLRGRVLRSSLSFTLVAVVTLAIGTGGIMTIFGVVNGVILHPLPYGDADRLVTRRQRPHLERQYALDGEPWDDRPQRLEARGPSARSR